MQEKSLSFGVHISNLIPMIHDQIQLAIKDVRQMEDKLSDVKKDMRKEGKIDDGKYVELKAGLKEMRLQVKDFEEEQLADLEKSDFYTELRELKLKAEEELAEAREKLFKFLAQVPLKPFEMDMNDEEGFTKIQAVPEMRIYVNGKEVKKK